MVSELKACIATEPGGFGNKSDRLAGLGVLVVDDDDDSRELLALVLQNAGARVTQAYSAQSALRALHEDRFDVLLSDIGMPIEDGYALIKQVRAKGNPVSAVAVTAFTSPEDRRRALSAGFQKHLGKPVDIQHLVDTVASLTAAPASAQ